MEHKNTQIEDSQENGSPTDYNKLHEEGILSHQANVVVEVDGTIGLYDSQTLLNQLQANVVEPTTSNTQGMITAPLIVTQYILTANPKGNEVISTNGKSGSQSPTESQEYLDSKSEDSPEIEQNSRKRKKNSNSTSKRKSKSTKEDQSAKKRKGRGSSGNKENVGEGETEEKHHSRYDSSLGLLTKKFLALVKQAEPAPDEDGGVVDLNEAAKILQVQKRRIYDITNVLEGIGLIEKKSKNRIHWKGSGVSVPEDKNKIELLKSSLNKLKEEELTIDEDIRHVQQSLRALVDDSNFSKYTYVTHDDIRTLPSMTGQTLIAIKAPAGTRLEVPDPDEGMDGGKRRYQIFLKSESGLPIDVYLVSQDIASGGSEYNMADVSEEILASSSQPATPARLRSAAQSQMQLSPSSIIMDSNSGVPVGLDPSSTTVSGGLLKLGAPLLNPLQLEPDYYLNNMYQTEGISDFYLEQGSESLTE